MLLVPFSASAESKYSWSDLSVFVGAGGSLVRVSAVDSFQSDVDFKVGEVLGGASWRWIGIEGRYGLSLVDETLNLGTNPDTQVTSFSETSIESYLSAYLRIQFENEFARIYGLYGETTIDTSSLIDDTTLVQASASGSSYGAGAGIRINDHVFFNLEYKVLIDTDNDTFSQTGFTVEFRYW